MYEKFYGFDKKPFQLLPDPDFLYQSEKHKSALTHLEYGVFDCAGFIVITGEIGTGKTTLIKYVLRSLKTGCPVALISQTQLTPEEFLRALCQAFSLAHQGKGKPEIVELFGRFAVEQFRLGRHVIVILDEAQNLPFETLEEIRMLSNLDAETRPILQIILVGQPALRERLQRRGLRQLSQRVEVSYHLEPLEAEEVGSYIRHRLERAGGSNPGLFEEGAIEAIYAYSKGVPRRINVVCHMCLVYGMADGLNRIDRSVVDGVLKDRSNWDLLSGSETSAEEESADDRGDTMEATGIQRMGHLDAKIDRFLEMSEASNRALERIASGLAGSANGNEVRRLNDRLRAEAEQIEMLRAKLAQIEKHLALVIKNQKRLARILLDGKEGETVFPGQTRSLDDHGP